MRNDAMLGNRCAADESAANSLPRNVKVVGWASFLNDVASEMIYPLMPQFLLTVLGGNRLHLGIIEGVGDSAASLIKLWSGAQSDRARRRKPFVVFGYSLAALARPLISLATAPWELFLVRIADRAGKGVRSSPRDALVADATSPGHRGRAFGFQRAMDNLGAAIGPVIAAAFLWLWPEQLRLLLLVTVIPGVAVVGLVSLGLHEAPKRTAAVSDIESKSGPKSGASIPLPSSFRMYLLALLVFTLGNSSDAFLLVRAGELGVPVFALPLLWFVFHLVKSAGNLLGGSLIDRVGALRPLVLGWAIYVATYLAFAISSEAWHAWAFFLSYGVFYALTEPAEKTLVGQLTDSAERGRAYGWYNFAVGIAALPASILFGLIYEQFGHMIAFLWGAVLAFGAMLILLAVRVPASANAESDVSS